LTKCGRERGRLTANRSWPARPSAMGERRAAGVRASRRLPVGEGPTEPRRGSAASTGTRSSGGGPEPGARPSACRPRVAPTASEADRRTACGAKAPRATRLSAPTPAATCCGPLAAHGRAAARATSGCGPPARLSWRIRPLNAIAGQKLSRLQTVGRRRPREATYFQYAASLHPCRPRFSRTTALPGAGGRALLLDVGELMVDPVRGRAGRDDPVQHLHVAPALLGRCGQCVVHRIRLLLHVERVHR
jgi:hypothetical protein